MAFSLRKARVREGQYRIGGYREYEKPFCENIDRYRFYQN